MSAHGATVEGATGSPPAQVLVGYALDQAQGVVLTCERTPGAVLELLDSEARPDRPDAWAILGRFEGARRSGQSWLASSGMLLDFDWKDPTKSGKEAHSQIPQTQCDRVLNALAEYSVPGLAHMTPRGLRWGCVFVTDVTDVESYEDAARGAADRLLGHLEEHGVPTWRRGVTGLQWDASSARASQPMRLPLPDQQILTTGSGRAITPDDLSADVPRLDLDAGLPRELADACRQIAGWVQIAPEVVVTGIMALASAAIGNSRWIVARGMPVPLSLHYLTVVLAGQGKSRVRAYLRQATKRIDEAIDRQRAEAVRRHQQYMDDLDQWERLRRGKHKDNPGPRPEAPQMGPRGNERATYLVSEGTIEGIMDTLEGSPRGFVWSTDEAQEVLGLLGRYGGDGARSLDAARLRRLMEGQPVERHRARGNPRPITKITRPFLSIDADVQPKVFSSLFQDEDRVSGLTARLLVHAPVSMAGRRQYVTPPPEPDPAVLDDLTKLLSALWDLELRLEGDMPWYTPLRLDQRAEQLWAEELERIERRYPGADDEEAGHLGHQRGRVLRLAGVLALLRDPHTLQVTEQDMRRAIVQLRYHAEHHRQLLGAAHDSGRKEDRLEQFRMRVERILDKAPAQGVSPRELGRYIGARYRGEDGRRRGIADLNAIGWEPRQPVSKEVGRKPQVAWYPRNPSAESAKRSNGARPHFADFADFADDARDLLVRASDALIASRQVDLPPPGRRVECAVCGSPDGLGVFQDDPTRWHCHSDRHEGHRGGCAVDLHLGQQLGRMPTRSEAVQEAKSILGLARSNGNGRTP